jgi:hypothetical protein
MLKKFENFEDIKVGMMVYYVVYGPTATKHEVIEDSDDLCPYEYMKLSDCRSKFEDGYLYYEDIFDKVSNDLRQYCDDKDILNKKVFEVMPMILEYLNSKYKIKEK